MCQHNSGAPKPKKTTKESHISIKYWTFPFSSGAAQSRHEHSFIFFSMKKNLGMIQTCQICACDHCSYIIEQLVLFLPPNNIEVLPFFRCSCVSLTALLCPGDHFLRFCLRWRGHFSQLRWKYFESQHTQPDWAPDEEHNVCMFVCFLLLRRFECAMM